MPGFVEHAQRAILAKKNTWLSVGAILAGVIASSYIRYSIDRGASGFLFSGYFPIILLAAILCGWRLGLLAVIASLVAMQIMFWPALWISNRNLGPPVILIAFVVTIWLVLTITEMLRLMIFRFEAQAREFAAFNAELIHRNKNALQILMAFIQRGLREKDMRSYFEALPQRLEAWARASELLRFGARPDCELGELVQVAIAPFRPDRFDIGGPRVSISGKGATALSMILHELGTNAMKYGALSNDVGKVCLTWSICDGVVELRWEERHGPPVEQPQRRGFGTMVLQRQAHLEAVDVQYPPTGVVATVRMRAVDL